MDAGPRNPLLPPEIPADVAQGLPSPTKAGWTPSELLQAVVGVLTLIFAILQSIPAVRAILPESTQSGIYVAAVLLVLGGILVGRGVRRLVRRRLQQRRERESASAPADRVTELAVFIQKARRTWSPESNYVGSFEMAGQGILNAINSGAAQAPTVPEDRRRAADHANFLFYGWRLSSATQDAVFWEMERLVDDLRTTDRDTFVTALLLLRQVLLGSIQVASSFADEVRRCEPGTVPEYARAQWSEFREQANRLSSDVNMLGERIKRDFGIPDLSFYFPTVRRVTAE
jgi:hypothetical protein